VADSPPRSAHCVPGADSGGAARMSDADEPARPSGPGRRSGPVHRSHRKTLATLGPARPDNGASGLARHALAEPVGLGPLAHVGLIGTFHPSTSFLALSRDRGRHTGRGPGRRDRGIPSHGRRERLQALVDRAGTNPGHGVPFRAQRTVTSAAGGSTGSAARRTNVTTPESQLASWSRSEERHATDTDAQSTTVDIFVDRSSFQGRRPT
jgi:hypothetical protein